MRLALAIGVALIAAGYLVIQFGVLVLDDATVQRETHEDAAYYEETVGWVVGLHEPNSEFDTWCEQAIALTRDPADADLSLWERELGASS